jgi:hypothetical protein
MADARGGHALDGSWGMYVGERRKSRDAIRVMIQLGSPGDEPASLTFPMSESYRTLPALAARIGLPLARGPGQGFTWESDWIDDVAGRGRDDGWVVRFIAAREWSVGWLIAGPSVTDGADRGWLLLAGPWTAEMERAAYITGQRFDWGRSGTDVGSSAKISVEQVERWLDAYLASPAGEGARLGRAAAEVMNVLADGPLPAGNDLSGGDPRK